MTNSPNSSGTSEDGQVVVHVFGRTDVGRTREHNEDAFVVADLTTGNAVEEPEARSLVLGECGTLFMVADGLGGAAAGEVASGMAIDIVLSELQRRWVNSPSRDPETFATAMKRAAETANTRIYEYAVQNPDHKGLGTTATIAGLLRDTLYVAQVGDSRAYLIRDGGARQITKDQSLMQRLIEAGEMTPEEAEQSERRNIILQALGPEPVVKIDLTHQRLRHGDILVLCTDGLSGLVRKDEIAEVVNQESDLPTICKKLIDRANANGGPDNITVVVVRFEGDGLGSAGADDKVGYTVFPLGGAATPTQPVEVYRSRRITPKQTESPPSTGPAPPRPSRGNQALLLAAAAALALAAGLFLAMQFRSATPNASPAPVQQDSAR